MSTPKSLSAILAGSRGNSTTKRISSLDITPANRATGSEAVANVYGGLKTKTGLQNDQSSEVFVLDAINLASPSPSSKRKRDSEPLKNMHSTSVHIGQNQGDNASRTSSSDNLECGGQNQDGKDKPDRKALVSSKDSVKGDIKSKNAADFLKEVFILFSFLMIGTWL